MKSGYYLVFIALLTSLVNCTSDNTDDNDPSTNTLFTLLEGADTGINFSNNLTYDNDFNVYKYRNFYNGGGVAIGDINNDNLVDVYFVSNQDSNRLYINKGDFKFEDVTSTSQTHGEKAWSTGVTMVDINNDGLLDIYVCNSGDVKGDNKENELFINNGDLTFTESAGEYGLNDKGFSTHASFFDYDKDGDLDAYILNNSFQAIGSFNLKKNERPKRDELGGDKLMRNDNGKFVDFSEEAGIYGSVIGFGLGITIGDINNDGWEDIFISNDFFERDYLYINQQDGTFKEDLVAQMPSISGASMGADIADINNDGYNDIFVTEMLPSDYERLKTVTTFDDWDRYQYGVKNGYHHQFTRNVMHVNNGNNTFSDLSRQLGVHASDWSWGALFFDMDNDGLKDLFIANGIYKDLTNQDYLQYVANESVIRSIVQDSGVNYKELIDIIPSNKIANHAYHNQGNLSFESYIESGLNTESFSNGAAYGDLDNDGDLDLIVNNINMPSFVYENNASELLENHFIKVKIEGDDNNTQATGTKIIAITDIDTIHYEVQPVRGFESTMDPRINIGIGKADQADIYIMWPDLTVSKITSQPSNSLLTVKKGEHQINEGFPQKKVRDRKPLNLTKIVDQENRYVDFNRERLMYHMMSTRGPCGSTADLNGDGILDLIIPGSKGEQSTVYIGGKNGRFIKSTQGPLSQRYTPAEHVKCEIFDADGDGDQDVYLASGGMEVSEYSALLNDLLLLNDGNANFTLSKSTIPAGDKISTGAITHGDFDGDGLADIFVGERLKIGKYGAKGDGYLLKNFGNGEFKDITKEFAPELEQLGMITDAKFYDFDGDSDLDLVVVGEFMPLTIFENKDGRFSKKEPNQESTGWWNVLEIADVNGDGKMDLLCGNHGLNSRFKASSNSPIKMYFNDFDQNGFPEGIMTQRRADGKDYPYALRHSLMARLPKLKKKYPNFEQFKNASISDIFTPAEIESSVVTEAQELRSGVFINKGSLEFEFSPFPQEAQSSVMYAIEPIDIDKDGDIDIMLGGNLYSVQPEVGRYDASYGHVMINDGLGNFSDASKNFDFSISGEVRDFINIGNRVVILRNNDEALSYELN